MGMRATFAHIDTKGTLKMTSVHWSTIIDKNLSYALKGHKNPANALSRLLNKVTSEFEHISALDLKSNIDYSQEHIKKYHEDDDPMPYGFMVNGGLPDPAFASEYKRRYTNKEAEKAGGHQRLIDDYHTRDGISVIYDVRTPDNVRFGWRRINGLTWQDVPVRKLASGNFESDYRKNLA